MSEKVELKVEEKQEEVSNEEIKEKKEKFSYSKLDVFKQCPFKYKLQYVDHHSVFCQSVATRFGTMIHHTEEMIGKCLKENKHIDYNQLIVELEETRNSIKSEFPVEWDTPDKKSGKTYEEKYITYRQEGLYRLEKRIKSNPNLKVVDLEKPFSFEFEGKKFGGFIDRIFYDTSTDTYIVEDIKTYSKPLTEEELNSPLQHTVYALSLINELGDINIKGSYDLPLLNLTQEVEDGFVSLGKIKLRKIFKDLTKTDYCPKPSALCHWCPYCRTFPNQPEAAKGLCPYCSRWTRENKDNTSEYLFEGLQNHERILKAFNEIYYPELVTKEENKEE